MHGIFVYLLLLFVVDAIALQRKAVCVVLLLHNDGAPTTVFFGLCDGHAIGLVAIVDV